MLQCVAVWRRDDRDYRLANLPMTEPAGGWPRLAIAFAARDEGPHVERAARSMLALDYPGLQVIAVDDRSVDQTGAILDEISTGDSRLQVIHVAALPGGWLGKTHALQMALDATEADWILFTDADVVFEPETLKRAISHAVRLGFDHLAVVPVIPSEESGERLFLAVFMTIFLVIAAPSLVENPRCKAALGIGAFNLVRAAALRSVGGFERIRLSVDDDMRLGQMLKWNGFRIGMLSGHGVVSVRWHVGMRGMIRGLEKNFFAAQEFRLWAAPLGVFGILFFIAGPHLGLLADDPLRWVNLAGVAALCGVLAKVGPTSRVRWYYGLATPVGALAMIYAMFRSVWLTLRNGGVVWRNHLYPLAELKTHVVERQKWLSECWKETQIRLRRANLKR